MLARAPIRMSLPQLATSSRDEKTANSPAHSSTRFTEASATANTIAVKDKKNLTSLETCRNDAEMLISAVDTRFKVDTLDYYLISEFIFFWDVR